MVGNGHRPREVWQCAIAERRLIDLPHRLASLEHVSLAPGRDLNWIGRSFVTTTGPETPTLGAMLESVAEGDRNAFEELYRLTSAKLFGTCLRILSDRQEAEDALQLAYLSVWRSAARYDPARGSPMAWLITMARNRAIDQLRADRSLRHAPMEEVAEFPDAQPSASGLLELAGETRKLHECMDTLDAVDAGFLRAAFFQGSIPNSRSARPCRWARSRAGSGARCSGCGSA